MGVAGIGVAGMGSMAGIGVAGMGSMADIGVVGMGSTAGMGSMEGTDGVGSGSASASGPLGAVWLCLWLSVWLCSLFSYPYTYARRSLCNLHRRWRCKRPPHPLSGTTVTIPRATIPMSNNAPVAGARWPQVPNSRAEEGTS